MVSYCNIAGADLKRDLLESNASKQAGTSTLCVCVRLCACVCVCVRERVHTCASVHACLHVYACMYVMCAHMCDMYMWI